MKRVLAFATLLLVPMVGYLLFWPVPIDPLAWEPPVFDPAAWKPTGSVAGAERVELQGARGPEDVEVDAEGRVYVSVEDGRILVVDAPGEPPRTFATTGGRPLGMAWAQDGRLLVADAEKGLLAVDGAGKVTVLTTTCAGTRMVFTDDLDVADDGTIYVSDASVKHGQHHWKRDIIEGNANGRLCAYDPRTRATRELLTDLHFANGVALDHEQQFVLVNETSRYRVTKLWIAGPKEGQREILIDNLPGFPDNLSTGGDGVFWIAIASPRDATLDRVAGAPFVRTVIVRLPDALRPQPKRTARAIGVDENGRVVADLFDPEGEKISVVTSAKERAGRLYFGSLMDTGFAHMPVPR